MDSIVVSINYRLGPLGFLAYPDAGLEGNYAVLDQLLALSWVQEEIVAFGGDPDKVLLFGQSAGAIDAFVLASLPQAPSLFRAVAMQSGGGRDSPNAEWTKPFYSKFIRSVGCSLDSSATVDCLRNVSITDMNDTVIEQDHVPSGGISASTIISSNGAGGAWIPVVDGKIVPENPAQVGVRVPAIFGSTTRDAGFFVLGHYGTSVTNITEADYDQFLSVSFGPLATTVNKTYPWSAFEEYSPLQGFIAMTTIYTDNSFKCPASRGLKAAASKGIDAWAYSFNHTDSCAWFPSIPSDPRELPVFGASHTSDIPFVFAQTKNLPRPNGSCNFTAAEDAISNFVVSAWTSMAENGRPANSSVWPAWTPTGSEGITITNTVSTGPLNMTECEFWDNIIDELSKIDASAAANVSASNATGSPTSTLPAPVTSGSNSFWTSKRSIAYLFGIIVAFLN
jgi:carboxylesterase type B